MCLQFKLVLAHDGSGQGAALVAAVAQKQLGGNNENNDQQKQRIEKQPCNAAATISVANNMWASSIEMTNNNHLVRDDC